MALFAIADLHLSLGEDKPMDVFTGWNDYTSRLENNWRKLVTDNDTVVVSGDISWAMKLEETLTDFTFIENLCKKIFNKGNHDYWWSTKTKMDVFLKIIHLIRYLSFSIIHMLLTITQFAVQEDGFLRMNLKMI